MKTYDATGPVSLETLNLFDEVLKATFDENLQELPSSSFFLSRYRKMNFIDQFRFRDAYLKYSFPILTHEFLSSICSEALKLKLDSAVELCAGVGWLSHWLNKYGLKCQATDNYSWHKRFSEIQNVQKIDAVKAVKESESKLFILSWPFMDNTAYRIWKAMKSGSYLLYIGEGLGGCTASEKFFKATKKCEVEDGGRLDKSFITFSCIHDFPVLIQKP